MMMMKMIKMMETIPIIISQFAHSLGICLNIGEKDWLQRPHVDSYSSSPPSPTPCPIYFFSVVCSIRCLDIWLGVQIVISFKTSFWEPPENDNASQKDVILDIGRDSVQRYLSGLALSLHYPCIISPPSAPLCATGRRPPWDNPPQRSH